MKQAPEQGPVSLPLEQVETYEQINKKTAQRLSGQGVGGGSGLFLYFFVSRLSGGGACECLGYLDR
jgi:hypothetical protein